VKELIPLLLITVAFVALIVFPARSRNRELRRVQAFQGALRPGDRVMTTSGLHGRITGLGEDTVDLEIAPGVTTTWSRMAMREVPAGGDGPAGPEDGEATGAPHGAAGGGVEPAAGPT
jgi:preprotein translocase subunit YajC